MSHFQIESQHLVGFVEEDSDDLNSVKVISKVKDATSDDLEFHQWMHHIYSRFIAHKKIPRSEIKTLLILLHSNDSADVYLNDFTQTSTISVDKEFKEGDPVYETDILDISSIEFPDIIIKPDDAIIYSFRYNWKFGLYFDFDRKLDLSQLSQELADLLKIVGFTNLTKEITRSTKPIFVITEGKTDWQHLEHARETLELMIELDFDKTPDDRGDTELLKICKYYARTDHGKILIFIFDRDNLSIVKELNDKTLKGKEFQEWGNNVFSFAIPIPEHRKNYDNVSIEFYYKDEEIRTKDKEGKRLFFDNELETRIQPGKKAFRIEISPVESKEKEKKIYDQDVAQIIDSSTGAQIALSKSNFAQNILTKEKDFDRFDVTEFNKIFDIIKEIGKYVEDKK